MVVGQDGVISFGNEIVGASFAYPTLGLDQLFGVYEVYRSSYFFNI